MHVTRITNAAIGVAVLILALIALHAISVHASRLALREAGQTIMHNALAACQASGRTADDCAAQAAQP